MSPDATYIKDLLQIHGPWMLTHFVSDLLAGHFSPNSTHAIVITGIDTSTNQVWFNNPWGQAGQVTTVDRILRSMEKCFDNGIRAVSYLP